MSPSCRQTIIDCLVFTATTAHRQLHAVTYSAHPLAAHSSLSVCLSHITSSSQFSTEFHQTSYQRGLPADVVNCCFWLKSVISMSAKPEVELILPLSPWQNSFNVKYLENGKRYNVGFKRGQTGNQNYLSICTMNFDQGRP